MNSTDEQTIDRTWILVIALLVAICAGAIVLFLAAAI